MKIEVIKDGKNYRIRVGIPQSMGYIGSYDATEDMLVAEARKLRDQLDTAIKKAEQLQRPGPRRFWDN